jgi:branched-chain amino acid transport system permease protein
LIFGIMRVVNFTHGEVYAFGGYVTYGLVAHAGVNYFAALPLAIATAFALGALLERALLRPMRDADIDTTMLVMIGAWIVMQNAEMMIWGGEAKSIATPFLETPLTIGPLSVSSLRVFSLVIAILLIAGTYGVINYTALGTTMRATFQDRETAMLMGVNVDAIHTLTFAIGSALAGAAGALLGPVFLVTPTMGDLASLKAFAIVILGGLGNITGAAIGGFALAMVEEMGAGYLSSDYRDAMGFVVIIVVLAIRPTGLFARAERVG